MSDRIEDLIEVASGHWDYAIAARCPRRQSSTTYRELWRSSGKIADALRSAGIGPGELVGVALPRDESLLAAILGIWRARCGYVPLNLNTPKVRLASQMQDLRNVGLRVAISDKWSHSIGGEVSHEHHELTVGGARLILSMLEPSLAIPCEESPSTAHDEDIAYVMFTSGSTGRPKGAVVTHANLVALFEALNTAVGLRPREQVLATSAITFDISILELIWPLTRGRTVVLLDPIGIAAPQYLAAEIAETTPKLLQLTPSTARALDLRSRHPHLRILVGGEAFPIRQARELVQHCEQLYGMYGPTETTVWVSYIRVCDQPSGAELVSLGQPLKGSTLTVVDDLGKPIKAGVPGEVFVSGPQVASGYLLRPDETARAFVTLPGLGPGYRTGDRAVETPEGLTFLGRIDDQVKIGGVRIEPAEVEAALRRHEQVVDAAVVVRRATEDEEGALHAFIQVDDALQIELDKRWAGHWAEVFDSEYRKAPRDGESNDLGIWRSAKDNRPLPPALMREWIEESANLVRHSRPEAVLDVGCGMGLLEKALANEIKLYIGLDGSSEAIEQLERRGETSNTRSEYFVAYADALDNPSFRKRLEELLETASGRSSLCIVMNSVIQYFPSVHYLRRVLKSSLAVLNEGDALVVSDIRSTHSDLDSQNHELCLDPRTFSRLIKDVGRKGTQIRVTPKFLSTASEFDFRYDIRISIMPDGPGDSVVTTSATEFESDLARVVTHLNGAAPGETRVVVGIANSRHIRSDFDGAHVSPYQLRGLLSGADVEIGIDPSGTACDQLLIYERSSSFTWDRLQDAQGAVLTKSLRYEPADSIPDAYGIWEFLSARFDGPMLPKEVRLVRSLPLNSSGKVDKVFLRNDLSQGRSLLPDAVVSAPRDSAAGLSRFGVDAAIANIMAKVLGKELGIDDDFVRTGGTSLGAARVAGAVWRELGLSVAPGQILALRTPRRLAALPPGKEGAPSAGVKSGAFSLEQRAMLARHLLYPSAAQALNVVIRWELVGAYERGRLIDAITRVQSRHDVLLTGASRIGEPIKHAPALLQRLISGSDSDEELARILGAAFDLTINPPVRWVVHESQGRVRLFASLHHIAVDDGALHTLHRDLAAAYDSDSNIFTPSSTSLTDAIVDEQILAARSRALDRAFWSAQVGLAEGCLLFRGAMGANTMRVSSKVPLSASRLHEAARDLDSTPFGLFLSIVASTVSSSLGPGDLLVGVPVSNRELVQAEGLLGCFANLLPIRVRDPRRNFESLVPEISSTLANSLNHSLLPYPDICRLIKLDPAELSFVCQLDTVPTPITVSGVTLTPRTEPPVALFHSILIRGEMDGEACIVHVDIDASVMEPEWGAEIARQVGERLLLLAGE